MQLEHWIAQYVSDPIAAESRPKRTDKYSFGLRAPNYKAGDHHIIPAAHVHSCRNIAEMAPGRVRRRCRRRCGRRRWRAIHRLRAGGIVGRERLAVTRHRVHYGVDMLAMLIRMVQTERMTEFMDKDPANIAYRPAAATITQRPAIGIELLIFVKQNVGLDNRLVHRPVVGDRKRSRSKFLSKDCGREDYRVDVVTRGSRSTGDVARVVQSSHDIVPSGECGGRSGIPRCISINQSASGRTEPHLEGNDTPARPADPLQDIALCVVRKEDTDGQNDQD